MSVRPQPIRTPTLESCGTMAMMHNTNEPIGAREPTDYEIEAAFDRLTETEKSAALIGESPDDFKPIGFLNSAHYVNLLKSNKLASHLVQRVEAFKQLSSSAGSC